MTISIKPTASGSTIEQDGSTVVSIESDRSVDIDSGTLHVDATNNRVGIGTSSPSFPLDISSSVGPVIHVNCSGTGPNTGLSVAKEQGSGDLGHWNAININGNDNVSYESRIQWVFDSLANGPVIGGKRTGNGETDLIFHTNSVETLYERMRIDSSGSVTIGTANATSGGTKYIAGGTNWYWNNWVTSTATKNQWTFNNPNGEVGRITTNGTTTAYNTSSDYRLKENITPMSGSINKLKLLKPCTWTWKIDGTNGQGFVAHEVQEVIPESVTGIKDGMRTEDVYDDNNNIKSTKQIPDYQGIDQSKLVPLLTAALQEAITKIEDLETRIQALESA